MSPPPLAKQLRRVSSIAALLLASTATHAPAQRSSPTATLDPARNARLSAPPASHLTEQFIWTAGDAAARDPKLQASVRGQDDKAAPHYFRTHFTVTTAPAQATLYLAGPRAATVSINGQEVLRATDDGTRPKNLSVLTADVARALHTGDNVLAIELVRGHSSLHTGASPTINQVTYGEVLAAKIVPAGLGVDDKPLVVSDLTWRSTLQLGNDWQSPAYDDAAWPRVESIGALGSKTDFLQWNADAGLYAWPGYNGISSTLRVFTLAAAKVTPAGNSLLYDFGREIAARVRLVSNSGETQIVQASYGESPEEALKDKGYLGTRAIVVPPHATVFGPKSAFRYVKLTLPGGRQSLTADAQVITYPVEYLGSFESSDAELNRIWETAAYTARLCMQEGIWDGVKRDRGRWMGDLDVTGRTIDAVFADPATRKLMESTMAEIIGETPVTRDINTITGYSALWITGEADFYRHNGDLAYLRSVQPQLTQLVALMKGELDSEGMFTSKGRKVFVDWSDGFSSDAPEARAATQLEFALAFREAAYLLHELGDEKAAQDASERAQQVQAAAQAKLLNPTTQTFGTRWQTNAWALVSDVANATQREAIWHNVLSSIGSPAATITPYQGYYALSAMAKLNHREAALQWMRTYWGGMLAEGATSFWEAYDPHWPKDDFHASLQADGKRGYYVSLAHGWASGPAAWFIEQVLGIQPTAAGFREVIIRPDLAGLAWAHGAEPTPRGVIRVDVKPTAMRIDLPPGTRATIELPFAPNAKDIWLNGKPLHPATPVGNGRPLLTLAAPGAYTITTHPDPR